MTEHSLPIDSLHQRALPVSNGTLAMWLFLSTEAMFFAALFSVWLVLRSSAGSDWPTAETMHAKLIVGLTNTAVLFASGWSAWMAVRASNQMQGGRSRLWILLTIVLGCLFLGIKAYEVQGKYSLGLVGVDGTANLRNQADALYVSALSENIKSRLPYIDLLRDDISEGDHLQLVQQGLVSWTAKQAGRSSDPNRQKEYFDSLAAMIYPVGDTSKQKLFLADEQQQLAKRRGELTDSQQTLTTELASLQLTLNQINVKPVEGEPPAVDPAKAEQASDRASAVTLELSGLTAELTGIESRLLALERFVPVMDVGINEHFGLRLPVAIPGSRMWSATWLLLTGMHALHMLAGMLAWLILLPVRSGAWFRAAVENCGRYWHFVDAVWIVIFLVVYCL